MSDTYLDCHDCGGTEFVPVKTVRYVKPVPDGPKKEGRSPKSVFDQLLMCPCGAFYHRPTPDARRLVKLSKGGA